MYTLNKRTTLLLFVLVPVNSLALLHMSVIWTSNPCRNVGRNPRRIYAGTRRNPRGQ